MKSLLLSAAALLLTGAAQGQMSAAQVPARAMLKAMFPTGQRTTWEKEANTFEAGFMLNGKAMLTVITPAGAVQETETDMSTSELPVAVRSTLTRDYRAYKINEAATIVRTNGTMCYSRPTAGWPPNSAS